MRGGLWVLVPVFEVPEPLVDAARWFIIAKCVQSVVFVLAAPLYNLYIVTERMGWANALIVIERVAVLGSILAVAMMQTDDIPTKVIAYGFISAASVSLVTVLSAIGIAFMDRSLMPDFKRMTAAGVRALFKNSMVQGTAVTAVNLHARIDAFIVNDFVGLAGNVAFGLGFQFASYIRRVAMGMTQGLDAVAARFSAGGGGERDVRWLLRRSTQLHAAVIFPIATLAIYYTPSLIDLWVGDLIDDNDAVQATIVPMVSVLAVGISARALSDAWLRILYGAGKVNNYLLPVVIAAVLNPIIAIALSLALPDKWAGIGPPLAMGAIFIVIHCGWIGVITKRELDANARDMVHPLIGPAMGTGVAFLVVLGLFQIVELPNLYAMLLGTSVFGLVYVLYCFFVVFSASLRSQIINRARRMARL